MPGKISKVLVGWKEISEYMGCSVATAARREKDGLPIFRSGGQVQVFVEDLDTWFKGLRAHGITASSKQASVYSVESVKDISGVLSNILNNDKSERMSIIKIGKDSAEFDKIKVELESAKEKYQTLLNETPEWIWELNASGEFSYSSKRITEILGYLQKDIIGFNPIDFLIHSDDMELYSEIQRKLTKRKEVIRSYICKYVHRDGTVRFIESSVRPVFDESGMLTNFSGISLDISDRVRLETEIAQTRRYFESVLYGSKDAIITTDTEGRIVIWNRSAESMFGYSEKEALNNHIDNLLFKNTKIDFSMLIGLLEQNDGWYSEAGTLRQRKDRSVFLASASYSTVFGANKEILGMSCIFRDLTEIKKTEAALHDSQFVYRLLLESTDKAVALVDESENIIIANQTFADILGRPLNEVIYHNLDRFVAKGEMAKIVEQTKIRKKNISSEYELLFTNGIGEIIEVSVSVHPVFDNKGLYIGAIAIVNNADNIAE